MRITFYHDYLELQRESSMYTCTCQTAQFANFSSLGSHILVTFLVYFLVTFLGALLLTLLSLCFVTFLVTILVTMTVAPSVFTTSTSTVLSTGSTPQVVDRQDRW